MNILKTPSDHFSFNKSIDLKHRKPDKLRGMGWVRVLAFPGCSVCISVISVIHLAQESLAVAVCKNMVLLQGRVKFSKISRLREAHFYWKITKRSLDLWVEPHLIYIYWVPCNWSKLNPIFRKLTFFLFIFHF